MDTNSQKKRLTSEDKLVKGLSACAFEIDAAGAHPGKMAEYLMKAADRALTQYIHPMKARDYMGAVAKHLERRAKDPEDRQAHLIRVADAGASAEITMRKAINLTIQWRKLLNVEEAGRDTALALAKIILEACCHPDSGTGELFMASIKLFIDDVAEALAELSEESL